MLVIKWSYKPNCNPPCAKIEIHRRESAASTTLLGTVGGTETEFRLPCKPGEYCIRCICEDGTPGAFHCCTATCGNHPFRRCDSNCSGVDDLSDDIFTLNQLFVDPTRRTCCELAQDCLATARSIRRGHHRDSSSGSMPPLYSPGLRSDGCLITVTPGLELNPETRKLCAPFALKALGASFWIWARGAG